MKTIASPNISDPLLVLLLAIVALAAGCVPISPRLDARFGEAVSIAKAQQTINPEASLNTEPVKGINGQVGDAIFDHYRNSFRNPQLMQRGAPSSLTSGGGSGNSTQ
ncbi:tRNA dimethylallyltransferase [Nitrosomonas sp. Is37]|uniref:tRNA dimethylallyltransferase n=1 Tax=Nitrosomonas sp. Is37 TaxID=3080535 RepID=UPI00294ACCB0|nr:tRNA dimethylallyltransferase [Nitrosomonas sp. Is37]MDV6343369.1 tRNA dimethylallyltransferase [Nitrosomonas sp. Is37]